MNQVELRMASLTRQSDLIPTAALTEQVTIIGAGAIGSWTALSLVKMGIANVRVIDFDDISVENLNCQFYRQSDIGQPKVIALRNLVRDFTGIEIDVDQRPFKAERYAGCVVSAVDSMAARRLIWDAHKGSLHTRAVLDPRMGAEEAALYVMCPFDSADVSDYEKTLHSDAAAAPERCTAKSTIYTANLLSGLVAKSVKDLITGGKYPRTTLWSIAANDQKSWAKERLH